MTTVGCTGKIETAGTPFNQRHTMGPWRRPFASSASEPSPLHLINLISLHEHHAGDATDPHRTRPEARARALELPPSRAASGPANLGSLQSVPCIKANRVLTDLGYLPFEAVESSRQTQHHEQSPTHSRRHRAGYGS